VTSFREKIGGEVSEGEKEGERTARNRFIDFENNSNIRPQFSDSDFWLIVSEVELLLQLARRI